MASIALSPLQNCDTHSDPQANLFARRNRGKCKRQARCTTPEQKICHDDYQGSDAVQY
jgi:hypothetical protein